MVPSLLSAFKGNVIKRLICCLLAAFFGFGCVGFAYAEEGPSDVTFRAEASAEEDGPFLRLYLTSEAPIDSFVLHLLLDPEQGSLAGDPIIEEPLRDEVSFTQVHVENDHSLDIGYCSAAGFMTVFSIVTIPLQYAEGIREFSSAFLSIGEGSVLTVFLPETSEQHAYILHSEGNNVISIEPVPEPGIERDTAGLAYQLRTEILDVTGNGVGDEADVTAGLMHAMGLIPDLEQLPSLLQLPLLGEKHMDKFRYTSTVKERNLYKSDMVSCELITHSEKKLTYYVLDIYIRDIHCLRTALGRETFGRAEKVLLTAQRNNAIYAINGDCYFARETGIVMQNGVVYRTKLDKSREIAVLFEDGTLAIIPPDQIDLDALMEKGAYQIWCFGPGLLTSEGEAILDNTAFSNKTLYQANPRTAIGYVEPGHYYFVVVDGRFAGGSLGMELKDLSVLMHSLGCTVAYNLDGGGTSSMVSAEFGPISKSADQSRSCSDIIYIIDDPT